MSAYLCKGVAGCYGWVFDPAALAAMAMVLAVIVGPLAYGYLRGRTTDHA